MVSVNNLLEQLPDNDFVGHLLRNIARTAWKPVSEPPTEADADEKGQVFEWWFETQGGVWIVTTTDYRWIRNHADEYEAEIGHKWARIRDVVLLPEGSGE